MRAAVLGVAIVALALMAVVSGAGLSEKDIYNSEVWKKAGAAFRSQGMVIDRSTDRELSQPAIEDEQAFLHAQDLARRKAVEPAQVEETVDLGQILPNTASISGRFRIATSDDHYVQQRPRYYRSYGSISDSSSDSNYQILATPSISLLYGVRFCLLIDFP